MGCLTISLFPIEAQLKTIDNSVFLCLSRDVANFHLHFTNNQRWEPQNNEAMLQYPQGSMTTICWSPRLSYPS